MKTRIIAMLFVFMLLLGACQPETGTPPPPPTKTSLPPATQAPSKTVIPTSTAGETVYITAFCTLIGKESTTHVPQGRAIVIVWGWGTKTESQVNDHLQNNITTITLDEKVIEGKLTNGIQKDEASGQYKVAWLSEVMLLDQGQHTITYDVKWKNKIEDGVSTYGPGGEHETEHDECLIIVE